jgi:hypothetical protein
MQHLFFKPIISSFQAIAQNGFIVNSDEHRLVSLDKSFLGVKECIPYSNDATKPFQYNAKDVFVLDHKQAHDLAAMLYEAVTGNNGTVFEYFETKNWDWAAFLFNEKSYSLTDFIRQEYYTESVEKIERNFGNISMFENLNVVIGVNNGYDANNGTTFYALIQHRNYPKGSFLTIDNFHFSQKDIGDYFRSGKKLPTLGFIVGYEVSGKFAYSIDEFAKNYDFLSSHYFTNISTQFIPICLDIHNINRSVTSMENDSRLRKQTRRLVDKADLFLKNIGNRKDYALLIDFLLSYSEFDLDEIRYNRRRVEEIFVTKRSYKNLTTRLSKTLLKPQNHHNYLDDQIQSLNRIVHLI